MDNPNTYCRSVANKDESDVNRIYHDTVHGFPLEDDNALFGHLVLEINQAGTSWTMVLNKQSNFYKAYNGFDIKTVAAYADHDRSRLLNDTGIIRNKLKVNAVIANAQKIMTLKATHGSFKNWLDFHHPKTKEEWTKLFKKTFSYTGGEITKQFLISTSYLEGAHEQACPIYKDLMQSKPKWTLAKSS